MVKRTKEPNPPKLIVTALEGKVTVGGKRIAIGAILRDNAEIQVAKGASCEVRLCQRLLNVSGADQVLVTSQFPHCLGLVTDASAKPARYEVLTPLGSVKILSEFAPS